jgi:hypothetical protein
VLGALGGLGQPGDRVALVALPRPAALAGNGVGYGELCRALLLGALLADQRRWAAPLLVGPADCRAAPAGQRPGRLPAARPRTPRRTSSGGPARPPQRAGGVVAVTTPQPAIGRVLARALAELASRPPAQRALVDQNSEVLRVRLARAGVPVTPATLAAFAAGVVELEFQAARASGVQGAAASLLHAAAQLAAPPVCPGCVGELARALADPQAGPPTGPGAQPGSGGRRPRGGGAR